MPRSKPSLVDHAQANPVRRGRPCWVCSIPEADEVNAAKREGKATASQMRRWLINACNHPAEEATLSRLNNHFQSGHHAA